jgi:glucan phosphoethanolaminetransferase (alkaline phosphatase superfamily)
MILVWPDITGKLIFGQSLIWGALGFAVILYSSIQTYLKNALKKMIVFPFLLLFIIVSLIGFLYGGFMQTHYVIAFHTSLIILFAMVMSQDVKRNPLVLSAICFLYFIININAMNLHQKKHPLQDGLSIKDFIYAASLIQSDKKGSYNVGMHAQGDNRAMPLRYMLKLLNETPEPYENYGDIESLYFLVKKNEPITSLKMWEYSSFGKSHVVKKWDVNDEYFLYKLEKKI